MIVTALNIDDVILVKPRDSLAKIFELVPKTTANSKKKYVKKVFINIYSCMQLTNHN